MQEISRVAAGEIAAFNLAGQRQISSGIQFVDLSGEPAKAQIVRQGYDVPAVAIDPRRVDQVVGQLTQVLPINLPRVLGQSIPAGTKVPVGTVVDIVLAARNKIPFSVFANAHADLTNRTLDAIDSVFSDSTAKQTLLTYSSADQVPADARDHLVTLFQAVDVGIDPNDPNKSFDRAFDSARGALAFQG
jgi:hypothetical protein